MSSVKLFNCHTIWLKEKIKLNKTKELRPLSKYSCVVLREELVIQMDSHGCHPTLSDHEQIIDKYETNEQIPLI